MVLVTASERRRGLARWLLRRCMDDLIAGGRVPLLDATPAGRTVYVGLGFKDCWTMRRLIARSVRPLSQDKFYTDADVRPVEAQNWSTIAALDQDVFGADRTDLLHCLAARLPPAALVAVRGGRIAGYLFGRDGRTLSQLGPLVAEDEGIARSLLSHAITSVPTPLVVDLPDRHAALGKWLEMLGFNAERPLTRMVHGRSSAFDDTARLFAIAGPELG